MYRRVMQKPEDAEMRLGRCGTDESSPRPDGSIVFEKAVDLCFSPGRSLQGHDWQAIVNDYGPMVWRTAYGLLGHHADTADCFQDTFLAALEVSRRQPVRNMAGLLVRLATTRAIDRLRQRGRQERRQVNGREGEDLDSNRPDPSCQVQTQELTWQLRDAIGRLPPQEAEVFCLRYLSEMSYRQIARELNIRINSVGVSLYRAKAKLREALGATPTEDDEVSHEKT
jgi:RNA polymerase sigma-70 factor (ECF subfamily)